MSGRAMKRGRLSRSSSPKMKYSSRFSNLSLLQFLKDKRELQQI
jgi:hypothetical protein